MLNEETLEWKEMTSEQVEAEIRKSGGRFSSACASIWETNHGYCVSDDCTRGSVFVYSAASFKKAVCKFNKLSK